VPRYSGRQRNSARLETGLLTNAVTNIGQDPFVRALARKSQRHGHIDFPVDNLEIVNPCNLAQGTLDYR
jgi:hypothetical protein